MDFEKEIKIIRYTYLVLFIFSTFNLLLYLVSQTPAIDPKFANFTGETISLIPISIHLLFYSLFFLIKKRSLLYYFTLIHSSCCILICIFTLIPFYGLLALWITPLQFIAILTTLLIEPNIFEFGNSVNGIIFGFLHLLSLVFCLLNFYLLRTIRAVIK